MRRRKFIAQVTGASAALLLGFRVPAAGESHKGSRRASGPLEPNAWLRIGSDDSITIFAETPEVGQGSRTYSAMLVAEELEVDWSRIRVDQAPTDTTVYKKLHTGGSGGVASSFLTMRRAGAQARERLRAAAAELWRVPVQSCFARNGSIVHTSSGRAMTYGQLALTAAKLPEVLLEQAPLKRVQDFRVIGTGAPRVDVPDKVSGKALFGIDVRLPFMLVAVIARCPFFGGSLKACDSSRAQAMNGVRAIFPVPALPRRFNTAGGVAVVADSTWQALQARKALIIDWERTPGVSESTADLRTQALQSLLQSPLHTPMHRGNAPGAVRASATQFEAVYESPFQAHATMEPMNTTIDVRADTIEVWSPTQFADEVQREIAELSRRPLEQIVVHMTLSGGSFGRRYQWDYAAEAWQIATEMRRPVQLLWTREDDFQHDFYRPYNLQRLSAGLDPFGQIAAWHTHIATTPIAGSNLYTNHAETPENLKDPATIAALEWYGADARPYAVPHQRIDYSALESRVPRSWWRSVSASFTIFAKECFIDELAHRQGKDPLDFRLAMLAGLSEASVRVRRVLKLAADKADWGTPLPKGHGRGIACRAGDSVSAQVADVAVGKDGSVRVIRVVAAVDCGIAVSPDGVRAMTEGAICFGLTAALFGQITINDGRVEQSNFHDYRVLRLSEAPSIETYIVPSPEDPSGVGELGVMLIGPAVANAIFAATGIRLRRLPIDRNALIGTWN